MISSTDMISITKCDQQTPLILDSDVHRISQNQSTPQITVSTIPSTSSSHHRQLTEPGDHFAHESEPFDHQHHHHQPHLQHQQHHPHQQQQQIHTVETEAEGAEGSSGGGGNGGGGSVVETTISESDELENKVFTVNDIQTLLSNQLLSKASTNEDGKQIEQQHLILVTQNGDKIILIQNSSIDSGASGDGSLIGGGDSGGMEGSVSGQSSTMGIGVDHHHHHPLNGSETGNESTILSVKKARSRTSKNSKHRSNQLHLQQQEGINVRETSSSHTQLNNQRKESPCPLYLSGSMPVTTTLKAEDDERDRAPGILQIRTQHRLRQQSLMTHLQTLRQQHKGKIVNNEILFHVPKLKRSRTPMEEEAFWDTEEPVVTEQSKNNQKSPAKHSATTSGGGAAAAAAAMIKTRLMFDKSTNQSVRWYPELCKQLQNAFGYVRRRSDSVEQLSKYFPSTSQNFQGKCAELRKEMRKIELNIERFQNVLDRELHQMNGKLKGFFETYHLETIASEIDEEDLFGQQQTNTALFKATPFHYNFSELGPSSSKFTADMLKKCLNWKTQHKNYNISKIELITPASISITPTTTTSDSGLSTSSNRHTFSSAAAAATIIHHEPERDDIDPVPEVRDIDCDAPLELLEGFYTMGQTIQVNRAPTVTRIRKVTRKLLKSANHSIGSPSKPKIIRRNHAL